MTFKQKIFAIISSIFLVLLIDQFFLHYLFPIKKAAFLKLANQKVQDSLLAHPPMEEMNQTPVPVDQPPLKARPVKQLTDFKTAAEECLGGSWKSAAHLAEDLEKTYGVQTKNRDIENFHLKDKNGNIKQIHITLDSPDKKQVRLFSVDKDGLPVPVALTAEQRNRDPEKLIDSLKSEGEIFLHQSKERWLLGNGSTFIVTFENNEVREFQIFGPSRTLSCLENSCQCL